MNIPTIAIVTKNRPLKLRRCLESLLKQTNQNFGVLIVDNDKARSAQEVAKQFSKQLSVRYVVESKPGVPHARNTALKKCKTKYLAYIDDDCVVDSQWVEILGKLLKKNQGGQVGFYLGSAELLNNHSLVALALHVRAVYWKEKMMRRSQQVSPYLVDTKNLVLDTEVLKKHNVHFDTTISLGWYDSADTDLGLQLQALGVVGRYAPSLFVHHEEGQNYFKFKEKAFCRGRLAYRLIEKWQLKKQLLDFALSTWLKKTTYMKIRELEYWFSYWQQEYKNYFPYVKDRFIIARWIVFFLIKFYDKSFLDGHRYESLQKV